MDEEGGQPVDDRKSTSELKWSLNRVTAPSLEPKKSWYILTKELCGYKPNYFARNEVYARFPAEIACVNTVELRSASVGCNINRQPKKTYVVSSFGLCCGLLKQRVYPDDGFIASPEFSRVIREINCMKLEEASAISDFGANDFGAHFENEAEQLKVQLDESNKTIDRLKTDIEGLSMKLMDLHSLKCKCGGSSQNSPVSNASDKSIEETKISPIGPIIKKRKINSMCKRVVGDLQDISEQYAETLGCVLGNYFVFGENTEKDQVRDIISETMDIVMEANNSKKPLEDVMHPSTYVRIMETMRVPDWVLLYFKIQAKLPDAAWQMLLNLTQLGRGGRNSDTPVLLTKNNIRAIRRHVFSIVRQTFGIKAMETEFHSAGVDLRSVLVWAVREQCLYSDTPKDIEFNIKLDGRPLGGKNQVAIGIVPINFSGKSSESYLSVYPLAIGNCKEERKTLIQLIKNLNAQKNLIKKHGIVIDGKHYNFKFTVTLDYKALLLLLHKKDDESFVLGGKGYGVEFCAFCDAVRACTSHGTDADEACLDCIRSKANIGREAGLRDDMTFLLEEDLSHINLCALHCEMRNLEQLLGSLGLFAHRIGSLDELNAAIADYGPEVSRGFSRITVQEKPGQQTAIERNNIKVASFSGSTERAILKNIENIVRQGLPFDKLMHYYNGCPEAAKDVILRYVTFIEERKMYISDILKKGAFNRDYGSRQELVKIDNSSAFHKFLKDIDTEWNSKQNMITSKFKEISRKLQQVKKTKKKKKTKGDAMTDSYSCLAAQLQLDYFVKACLEWKEIAETLRDRVFAEDEEYLIDIHDVKCKEWGFLLKHLFGMHLGTGDYGHLVIDHSAMLLRQFRSLQKYSGQGFEASHKLHRQLYSKASNHDASGPGQSLDEILTHWYATHLLSMRYRFRKALECLNGGKNKLSFRGCGRKDFNKPVISSWPVEMKGWVSAIDSLFTKMLGDDFLIYKYQTDKGTYVHEEVLSNLVVYDHDNWENECERRITEGMDCIPPRKKKLRLSHQVSSNISSKTTPVDDDDVQTQSSTPPTTHSSRKASESDDDDDDVQTQSTHSSRNCGDVVLDSEEEDNDALSSSPATHMTENGKALQDAIQQCNHTRGQLASLYQTLPAVANANTVSVHSIHGKVEASNPFTILTRPSATDVEMAEQIMRRKDTKGVKFNGIGSFDEKGLSILKMFCKITDTERQVAAETKWLAQLHLNSSDKILLENGLWHLPCNHPLVKFENKCIDVLSFSYLTQERYIDNFTIDVCIGKMITESKMKSTLYLPTEFHTWMETRNKDYIVRQLQRQAMALPDPHNLRQIIAPVYMTNHWGLVYIDLQQENIFFDDGMKIEPPKHFLSFIKQALDLLSDMFQTVESLQSHFWNLQKDFIRFGMPSQVPYNSKMIGSGSCGVGVILAAEDFILNGPKAIKNFKWKFSDMDIHRKDLMLRILAWN